MKKLLSFLALMLTVCSTAMAETLTTESAAGTIGTLNGREAMVVDLGGSIGKIAIATMNLGATDVNDYGTQFSSEADFDPASLNLTDGWYVPTIEELSALKDKLQPSRDSTGFEYTVGESTLFLPGVEHDLSGKIMYVGKYMSSSQLNTIYHSLAFYFYPINKIQTGDNRGQQYPATIRPFHKLPLKENCRIYYTSSDNNVVTPNNGNFNVSIVSNTYDNGKGIITFSGELTSIGSEAFKQKATLTSVTIPASLKSIGDDAFGGCSKLSSLTFAEGSQLTTIGNRAFKETSITGDLNSLPASLKSIENNAFSKTGIYSVTFPALLENIGDYAFSNCDQLSSFTFAEGSQLIRIGTGAFQGTVISGDLNYLPASLKYFGESAFNGTKITAVTIPASVISIGEYAFSGCHDLKTLTFAQNSQLKTIEGGAFSETIITGQLLLPASLISIGDYAFNGAAISGKLTIPASVKSIGGYAFNACNGLTSLTFAEGSQLEMIGSGAFNATAISGELTIPSSVTNIGGAAFDKCPLTKVRMSSVDLSNIEKIIFIGSTVIIVPAELYEAYKSHFGDVNKVETSLTELQEYTKKQIEAAMNATNTISDTDKVTITGYISTIENAKNIDETLEAYHAALALIDRQKTSEEKVKDALGGLATGHSGPAIRVTGKNGKSIMLFELGKVEFFNIDAFAQGEAEATGIGNVRWIQLWEGGPKFAEYNIGATSVTDDGGYYTWGGMYKNGKGITWDGTYNEGSSVLSGETDTATNLWGSNWRMPTSEELTELINSNNCDIEWTTVDGVNGCKFTGKGDYKYNSIFLPAAGTFDSGRGSHFDEYAFHYWSSTPNNVFALKLISVAKRLSIQNSNRNIGSSVRAVLNETK